LTTISLRVTRRDISSQIAVSVEARVGVDLKTHTQRLQHEVIGQTDIFTE